MAKKTANNNTGLGMAYNNHFTHQKIQSIICKNYLRKYDDENILIETKLSDDRPRICPDISIWGDAHMYEDIDPENPLLTIEITHTRKNDRYSEGVIRSSFVRYPSIQEAFVYNFETNVWTRFSRADDGVIKEEGKDQSRVLECFLHTLLK
ncbi:MAG: hypothetical protein MJZ33_05180 [Paludibacteraceae bacterium]|nr:hypothetical protein [Paludibacteraceae bacterium]